VPDDGALKTPESRGRMEEFEAFVVFVGGLLGLLCLWEVGIGIPPKEFLVVVPVAPNCTRQARQNASNVQGGI
jgi:hypothetical protein